MCPKPSFSVGRWAELRALHDRLLVGDPTAPNDMARAVLHELVEHLQASFASTDRDIVWEAAVAAFLDYSDDPAQCEAASGDEVFRFLTMVGWRRVRDVRRAEKRRVRWEGEYALDQHPGIHGGGSGAVELSDPLAKLVQDEEATVAAAVVGDHRERVMAVLTDERDRRVQEMRFAGERSTAAFASVLGIAHLPAAEQKQSVKRNKDRIDKVIERALGPGTARVSAPGKRARRESPLRRGD